MTHLAAIARLVAKEERRDGELLAAFLLRRDEAAFAELIRRHGPMVWGVCRRSLPDAADAEDAFQAVFLVLVRKAHQLTRQATVGPWLYRVAAWTARNLRRKNARRLSRTVPLKDVSNVPPREPDLDLDAALLALPEKYRTPLMLCHLIGLSRREAALQLGCPEGTLSARLSRALAKLRVKLLGQDPLPMLAAAAGGIVPATLATATERTAIAFALASLLPTTAGPAAMLAEGVLRMFWIKKAVTAAVAAMVMMGAAGVMVGVGIQGNSQIAIAQGPQNPDKLIRDRFLFVRAYSHILKLEFDETVADANNRDIDRVMSGLMVLQKQYGLDPVIPLEVKVAGYRNPEHELDYLRMRLKNAPKSLNQHPQIKEIEAKIKFLESWKLSEPEKGPFTVSEQDSLDDNGLNTNCWSETALTKHLTRIHRDEKASKEILILVSKKALPERLTKALKAAHIAGFKGGRIYLHPEINFTLSGAELRKEGDLKLLECKTDDFSKLTVTPKK